MALPAVVGLAGRSFCFYFADSVCGIAAIQLAPMVRQIAIILFSLCLPTLSFAQGSRAPTVFPLTAEDLEHLCKTYNLVSLQVELKKNVDSDAIRDATACLNFVMGVLETISAMDVGFFPELRYELANSDKPMKYRDYVDPFMKRITAHPEDKKEGAAGVVALSLMEAGIVIPAHWVPRNDAAKSK